MGQEGGQAARPPMMAADLFGKIKSVDGDTITLYKSAFQSGGGGGNRGPRPSGQDQNGEPPAEPPQGGGEGFSPPEGGEGQRPERSDMFTEETVDVRVTAETKISKTAFENGERKETELTLSDLKADDIVSVDLGDDSSTAATITLNEGGFGDMGGGGGRRNRPQGDAPASPPAAP